MQGSALGVYLVQLFCIIPVLSQMGRVGEQRRKEEEKKSNMNLFGAAFSQYQHFAGQLGAFMWWY